MCIRDRFYQYLILNSDGLTDYVKSHKIHDVLKQEQDIHATGQAILDLAVEHEAKDNISFVLAEIAGEPV